uniref:CCHC-type domain-containing protein n=1 Tax=Tanacetum cinerariifolium TaxID=118510 RepID=A0A6L2N6R4_TANCI|nr:hypothetical protein [Tanacetum cinerariifolium]
MRKVLVKFLVMALSHRILPLLYWLNCYPFIADGGMLTRVCEVLSWLFVKGYRETGMVMLVVEIDVGDMTTDVVNKLTYSSDDVQPMQVMDAPTIPISAEENLGDPIDIRVDIIHPEPVDVEQLLGVPIQEELTALRFRVDIAEAENASLRARIKTTKAIEKITRSQEIRARMEMERQLASVQESQRQDRENFRKLQKLVTSQLGPQNFTNPRQHATISNERVTIQPIQERQNSMAASSSRPYTSGSSGTSGKRRVIVCYNCKGEGHMSKQCTKPKRKRDEQWFKDKVLLVQAQANGQVL